MNCAIVNKNTMIVENIIVADPITDDPPVGCILVGMAYSEPCDIGWIYNPAINTFSDPNPPPQQEVVI